MTLMDGLGMDTGTRGAVRRVNLAVVGGGSRAASVLRLLGDLDIVTVAAVHAPHDGLPAMRLANELGLYATTELSEVFQVPGLDLVVDMSDDPTVSARLEQQRPSSVGLIGGAGSELVWDLLVAKKRGEEHERLFVELQVAYDKIRSHEQRLQMGKEALERANDELEGRLAEIFFTHEFFKALTSYSTTEDVCSLIVDGCNGILGAEISCVYLFNREDWTLRLRASQGRSEDAFRMVVPISETILGHTFREGVTQQERIDPEGPDAAWFVGHGGIASQAAVPLRAGDSVFGVIVVACSTLRELGPAEMERFQVLGNQSSLSLQNSLLHEELERMSVTDRLTELYNHGYFKQRLEEEFKRSARFAHPMALIMIDIDDFKIFNDTYGHLRGDEVLRAVSGIIRCNLREMDIAARYGGEEFVVVLPETDLDGADLVAERIRSEVEQRLFENGDGTRAGCTVSVGTSAFPRNAESALKLLEAADAAMYRGKHAGKNRVQSSG